MTPSDSATSGRRERNKQEKLARITAAADDLFTAHGVDDVTTQQIADAADIGTGTLFLYARSKAELLLLVQNTHYADAIDRGLRAAAEQSRPLDAVMALVEPVVECNRRRIENGRMYLRELVFGDPEEPHHKVGLDLIAQVDQAYVAILRRGGARDEREATLLARAVSAVMFVSLASPIHVDSTDDEVLADIRAQVDVLLR